MDRPRRGSEGAGLMVTLSKVAVATNPSPRAETASPTSISGGVVIV